MNIKNDLWKNVFVLDGAMYVHNIEKKELCNVLELNDVH